MSNPWAEFAVQESPVPTIDPALADLALPTMEPLKDAFLAFFTANIDAILAAVNSAYGTAIAMVAPREIHVTFMSDSTLYQQWPAMDIDGNNIRAIRVAEQGQVLRWIGTLAVGVWLSESDEDLIGKQCDRWGAVLYALLQYAEMYGALQGATVDWETFQAGNGVDENTANVRAAGFAVDVMLA